jgi:hypothetical protein
MIDEYIYGHNFDGLTDEAPRLHVPKSNHIQSFHTIAAESECMEDATRRLISAMT